MADRTISRSYRREDIDEFDRKLRRFHESLAHKERRMLREIITAALEEEEMEVKGFLAASDDAVFDALASFLRSRAEADS